MGNISHSTDVSQFWEWSGRGFRPFDETNEANNLGVHDRIDGLDPLTEVVSFRRRLRRSVDVLSDPAPFIHDTEQDQTDMLTGRTWVADRVLPGSKETVAPSVRSWNHAARTSWRRNV